MADPLSILFVPKPNRRVAIGAIQLDATIRESHSYRNRVTNHPIETGSFVTDHVYSEPISLELEGEITDTPVQIFSLLAGLSQRRIEAFEQLVALKETRDVITVVTGLKIYNNMVIEDFDANRDQKTGRKLSFTARFQEVRKVASQVVGITAEKAAPAQKDQVQSEQDIGRQEATTANAAQDARADEVNKSVAASFFDSLGL